jgi:hypothetical protein
MEPKKWPWTADDILLVMAIMMNRLKMRRDDLPKK